MNCGVFYILFSFISFFFLSKLKIATFLSSSSIFPSLSSSLPSSFLYSSLFSSITFSFSSLSLSFSSLSPLSFSFKLKGFRIRMATLLFLSTSFSSPVLLFFPQCFLFSCNFHPVHMHFSFDHHHRNCLRQYPTNLYQVFSFNFSVIFFIHFYKTFSPSPPSFVSPSPSISLLIPFFLLSLLYFLSFPICISSLPLFFSPLSVFYFLFSICLSLPPFLLPLPTLFLCLLKGGKVFFALLKNKCWW